ncbi:hypothetical protein ED733_002781 [Metarhizium rileyi]|uniref:Uncharacterized protein n=1 Tax=Metarhizium rileyi (strain RCEF 4871) TaxID=1649241 RepID=A0A5C6G1N5_METRR|nr:hypothetical protein ED733_002781 [Metarhizium rileyi]
MHFIPCVAAVLALGTGSSLSFPTQVGGFSLPQVERFKGIGLAARDLVLVLGPQDQSKQVETPPTPPPDAAPAPAPAPASSATPTATNAPDSKATSAAGPVLKVKGDNPKKLKTNGGFGSPNPVQGGFLFTKMNLPLNNVGNLEVEYNGTEPNTVLVAPKMADTPPPSGMVFVDPMTFIVSTEKPPVKGDTLKIDYIFTEAVKLAVDPAQVRVGKLDPATKQFVTEGLGEFEFEKEENEWSQEVEDLNGEWAILAPQSAQLAGEAGEAD